MSDERGTKGGLSDAEHRAMDLTGQLATVVINTVIGESSTREADVNEFVSHIHVIQRMIMAQSAARAHPELYRCLGGLVQEPETL